MKIVKLILVMAVVFMGTETLKAQDTSYEMTVAADGSGDFTSVQAAINATKAFPDQPVVIHIKKGVYNEKVRVYSWNTRLTLKGESTAETIITFDDHFDRLALGRNSTFHTYTMKVEANDFKAENLTVINSAGPVGQAVALHVEGDRCVFVNCRILGHQDTLYAAGEGSRQYFHNCYIEGTTDFIFGESIAVFDRCTLNNKSDSYLTAASTPKTQAFGYVFRNCKITADAGVSKACLGRPWRDYAKVVYIDCELGSHILPEGWANWSKTDRDKTAFFAEYGNKGPGSDSSKRVYWSHQLKKKEAKKYTVANIFKARGSDWLPANE